MSICLILDIIGQCWVILHKGALRTFMQNNPLIFCNQRFITANKDL